MKQLTDRRQALPKYTVLDFGTEDFRGYSYTITAESGRGASCIVYQGFYENSLGEKKTVYIKECYPHSVKMTRTGDGTLSCEDAEVFEDYKKRFRDSFSLCNRIFETEGLTNTTSNYMDIHEKNGTLYTVITYRQGQELSLSTEKSLREIIRILKSVAKAIAKIHDNGYLYLDTKPDNVFVLDEMNESIQLFDFDSMIPIDAKGDLHQYRISYSNGFAPLEQRRGRLDMIGRYTDVYGVGALLFYLVFGRVPQALDCEIDSDYDFTASRFDPYKYRDRLWKEMTKLFHHSIASYCKDRYEDMDTVIEKLEELEALADLTTPFICDTYFPVLDGMIGREREKEEVKAFLQNDEDRCLLVSGMGGIGKSTLVRNCLAECREDFDYALYLYFRGSVMETIADDHVLTINTVERNQEETLPEYFDRKLSALKRIIGEKKAILVLDDFAGEPGDEILALLNIGFRIIMVSREQIESDEWRTLSIEEMKESSETIALFVRYLSRDLKEDEKNDALRLISDVHGHTLAIELIAKQIRRSFLTVKEAAELVVSKGLTLMSPEKVSHSQDGSLRTRHVEFIFQELIRRDHFEPEKFGLLKALSLYDPSGVREDILTGLMGRGVRDDLYDLESSGWIGRNGNQVNVHPVIREIVLGMKPDKNEYAPINRMLNGLGKKLVGLGAGERYGDKSELRGSDLFGYSVDVLKNAGQKEYFRANKPYYRLFCPTVLELPRDREDVILGFISNFEEAWEYSDPLIMVRVVDFACYVLYEKGDMDAAIGILAKAGRYANQVKDPRLSGMFYEAESQFYDTLLAGGYDSDDAVDKHFRKEMVESLDTAIRYMYRAFLGDRKRYEALGPENKELIDVAMHLAELHLTKANYAIRAYPVGHMSDRKIRKHISTAKKYMDMLPYGDDIVQITYELSVAWYYTMVKPDKSKTVHIVKKLLAHRNPWSSEIDRIDFVLVPCAEMLYRISCKEESEKVLMSGVAICDEHEDVAPYQRKKEELLDHIEDVRA